jgi:hypothetical protein
MHATNTPHYERFAAVMHDVVGEVPVEMLAGIAENLPDDGGSSQRSS